MVRVLNIFTIIASFIFIVIYAIFIKTVSDAKLEVLLDKLTYDPYSTPRYADSFGDSIKLTRNAGIICMLFLLFYAMVGVITLIKLKTKTMKIISIIGVSFTAIMLIWDLLVISSSGAITFDEVGRTYILFGLMQLSFSIVGTVHAFRKKV